MEQDRATSSGSSGSSGLLVGRAAELDTLARRAAAARAGRAGLVTLVGPAGIGKSTVLRAFLDTEAAHDVTVLHGRCGQDEAGAGYGGVRALFGSLGLSDEAAARSPLLRGQARRALPALAPAPADEHRSGADGADSVYPTMHGLYWLAANLMSDRPLVLVLDDVHWCDERSLRWLEFLLRRADDLPLLVVLAQRSEAEPVAPAALADLAAAPRGETVALGPLGERDVTEVVERSFAAPVDPGFAARAASVSGGNPLTLDRLLHELRTEGVRPDADGSRRITEVGGHVVASSVRGVLTRQPEAVRDVATAVAVLGERAAEHVGALAGVSAAVLEDAVAALRRAEMVDPDRLALVHDVVRTAVLDMLDEPSRAALRTRAALLLNDAGRPAEEVANHLMLLERPDQPWMLGVLREAAAQAESRGAPEAAARYLYRVLDAESGSVPVRIELAKALAEVNAPEALSLLEAALDGPLDARTRLMVAAQFGMIALSLQRGPAAVRVLEDALTVLDAELGPEPAPADQELRTYAEAVLLMVGTDEKSTVVRVRERATRIPAPPGDTPAQRQLLTTLNLLATMEGESAERTVAGVRRVLRSPGVQEESWLLITSFFTLSMADEIDESLDMLGRVMRMCQERAAVWTYVLALSSRAFVLHGLGAVPDALADAQTSLEICEQEGWNDNMTMPQIALASVLVDRGEPDRAERLLAGIKRPNLDRFVMEYHPFLMARGRALWQLGDKEGALRTFLHCGESLSESRMYNPAFSPWWVEAARLHAELGRPEQARELVDEFERLAHRWGTRRARGLAAHARGLITPGQQGLELLAEAVDVLAGTPARGEHARAEHLLGRALLDAGDQRAARERLRSAVDHAQRCGALALAADARRLLVSAGGRTRRMSTSPLDALTGTERKVAGLAADGASNRAIAESLFVTVRTVETHLTSAYRKLGVSRRAELGTILHSPEIPARRPPAWGVAAHRTR